MTKLMNEYLSKDDVYNIVNSILNVEGIYSCFLFGSYGTERFTKYSDIDIAIITDFPFYTLGEFVDKLESKLNRKVDLVILNDLPPIIKLNIAFKSNIVFTKSDLLLNKFYDEVNFWYKTDFRIYKSWLETKWSGGMDMVRINGMRLEELIENFEECLKNLEDALFFLNSTNDSRIYNLAIGSFRYGITSIFTNTEDYLGMVLKKVGVGVSDKTFRQSLKLALDNGLIDEDFANCISKSINIRNSFSHGYNVPTTEDLINFYTSSKNVFHNQLKFMKNLSNKESLNKTSVFDDF